MSTYAAPLMPLAGLASTLLRQPAASPPPPTGPTAGTPSFYNTPGFVGYWIKKAYYPQVDPSTLNKWATIHQQYAQQLDDAADESQRVYVPQFHEHLQGRTGDLVLEMVGATMSLWRSAAAEHQSAAAALNDAAYYLGDLQSDLNDKIADYGSQWDTAVQRRDIPTQDAIVGLLNQELPETVSYYAGRISGALNGKFGPDPLQPQPRRVLQC